MTDKSIVVITKIGERYSFGTLEIAEAVHLFRKSGKQLLVDDQDITDIAYNLIDIEETHPEKSNK